MATNAGTLEVVITATTSGLTAGIANARTELNKVGPDLKRYGTLLAGTVVAGLTASVYAFGEAQVSATLLSQALKNQGVTSKAALEELIKLSSELQHLSGFSDEAIQGASRLIVKFGATGETLKRLTRDAVDAAAQGHDLEGAAEALGKAYLGETGRLKQYGIAIDETIPKTLRFSEALRQWEEKFGGSAAAKGKTFFGMIGIAKGDVSDFAEEIGRNLVPTVQRFVQFMIDNRDVLMKAAGDVGTSIRNWIDDFADVLRWIDRNKGKIGAIGSIISGTLKGPFGLFQAARGIKSFYEEPVWNNPPTVPRAGPAPLVPAGMGKAGRGGGGDAAQSPDSFAQAWESAILKVGGAMKIWSTAIEALIGGVTNVMATGFNDAFLAIADGGTTALGVLQKMGLGFRNLVFKIVADIIAQWITANILMMAMTRTRQVAEITGAASVAAANNVAAMAAIPFGWIAGIAAAGAIIAMVMSFAKFAEGGIVTGPTLGLFGEAGTEAVIPLDKGKEMGLFGSGGGDGGKGGGVTEVHLHFDGATFVDADETKWDNLVRRYVIPALAAYQDKTRANDFRRWPTRTA